MFERFTQDARAVVHGAVTHSQESGAATVSDVHVLLALLDREGSKGSFVLAALGLPDHRASLERDLDEARRRAGLSRADAEALEALGIDLAHLVSQVEVAHGVGALAPDRGRRGWFGPQRPFTPDAKNVLQRSLRIAVAHRDRRIGDEHILLALTARPGVVAETLADHGVTYASVERVLYGTAA